MAQFRPIQIPKDAIVLLTVAQHESEIPKDGQGRFLPQIQQAGASNPESVKEKLFHGGWKGADGPAKVDLPSLIKQGFRVNNICSIADEKREGYYTIRVWLNYDDSANGKKLEDWKECGEYAKNLFARIWSSPKVVKHNGGKMISFGMYGKDSSPNYPYTVLQPKVLSAPKGEPEQVPVVVAAATEQPEAAKPKAPKVAAVLVSTPTNAMGAAFAKVLQRTE